MPSDASTTVKPSSSRFTRLNRGLGSLLRSPPTSGLTPTQEHHFHLTPNSPKRMLPDLQGRLVAPMKIKGFHRGEVTRGTDTDSTQFRSTEPRHGVVGSTSVGAPRWTEAMTEHAAATDLDLLMVRRGIGTVAPGPSDLRKRSDRPPCESSDGPLGSSMEVGRW